MTEQERTYYRSIQIGLIVGSVLLFILVALAF